MRNLLSFAQRDDIQSFKKRAMASPSVQGVCLDYDRFWLKCWEIRRIYGSGSDRLIEDLFIHPLGFGHWPIWLDDSITDEFSAFDPKDVNWRPKVWDLYCKRIGRPHSANPFVVIVRLLPNAQEEPELPTSNLPCPVVFEKRPRAELLSKPKEKIRPLVGGVSIGSGDLSGTLGGLFEGEPDRNYGMTCAHVIEKSKVDVYQPSKHDNNISELIGDCIHRENIKLTNPKSDKILNKLDLALIKLNDRVGSKLANLHVKNVTGLTLERNISRGQSVFMSGKEHSRKKELKVGPVVVGYDFSFGEKSGTYYFEKLFEIRTTNIIRLMLGDPVQNGDSGAWVFDASDSWCGMVIAGDGVCGYAHFGEQIKDWVTSKKMLSFKI